VRRYVATLKQFAKWVAPDAAVAIAAVEAKPVSVVPVVKTALFGDVPVIFEKPTPTLPTLTRERVRPEPIDEPVAPPKPIPPNERFKRKADGKNSKKTWLTGHVSLFPDRRFLL